MATQRDMEKWDTRVIERNIQSGRLKPAELEAHLAKLPDVASKAAPIEEHQPLEPQEAQESDSGEQG